LTELLTIARTGDFDSLAEDCLKSRELRASGHVQIGLSTNDPLYERTPGVGSLLGPVHAPEVEVVVPGQAISRVVPARDLRVTLVRAALELSLDLLRLRRALDMRQLPLTADLVDTTGALGYVPTTLRAGSGEPIRLES